MLEDLRKEVYEANMEVVRRGLVLYTFGNASGIDRERGRVAIKPSGVDYDKLRPADMVVVDLDGRSIEGNLRPSSDLATHLILYRAFPQIGGSVHTHSRAATVWAQACRQIPCFGTTHADYFHGPVPVTEPLTEAEVQEDYEANTGRVIVERFAKLDPLRFPGVLVASHAPFAWGATIDKAVENAAVLEHLALLASETLRVKPSIKSMPRVLLDKHFLRKHGPQAYYGQKSS